MRLLDALTAKLREFFTRSSVIHIRFRSADSVEELIHLIDRFIDGPLRYDLEWDDFISWKNDNPHLEDIRNRIGEFEPLLLSPTKENRIRYSNHLIEERNRLSALLNLPKRDFLKPM
jgi:hypothetical protein